MSIVPAEATSPPLFSVTYFLANGPLVSQNFPEEIALQLHVMVGRSITLDGRSYFIKCVSIQPVRE